MVFLLKLTICWGFFALLYALMLRRETFFRANRLYLLGTALLGVALAAFGDRLLAPVQDDALYIIALPAVSATFQQAAQVSKQVDGADYLWWLYIAGFTFMLLRTAWGVSRLMQMAARGISEPLPGGSRLIYSTQVQTPFSFFKWVFVPADWDDAPQTTTRYILAHERAHAEGWHSLDIILMECLCAFFWFHPLSYWYRRSLRVVHEYLADAQASRLTDKKQYGLLLIGQSQSGMPVAFANHFFQSPLKQRLIMLMKQHSAPVRALRYGLVLPLTGLFILLFQQAPVLAQEVNHKGDAYDHQMQVLTSSPAEQVADNPCEQEPAFPGGMGALMDFMAKNVQFPKNADGSVHEGIVVTSFTVNEVGGIQNVYVKNPSEMPTVYNAEALRVVGMLPKWTPGKKNCKPALFELCIPIKFKANEHPVSKVDQAAIMNVSDLQTPPHYTGGQEELIKYLIANVKYPEAAKQAKAEAMVVVKFIVEKDGSISNVEAQNKDGVHADLIAESIRVVQTMPKWVPGVVDGKIVRVEFMLPIRFKLD